MTDTPDKPRIIALPPLIFGVFLVAGLAVAHLWTARAWTGGAWIGVPLIALALIIASSAVRVMKRHATAINPRRPTTAIVTEGPFGLTRNPLYLSMILLYLGIAASLNSLSMALLALVFALVLRAGVIIPEERYLEDKFGDTYRDYKSQVRRWL